MGAWPFAKRVYACAMAIGVLGPGQACRFVALFKPWKRKRNPVAIAAQMSAARARFSPGQPQCKPGAKDPGVYRGFNRLGGVGKHVLFAAQRLRQVTRKS